MIKNIALLLACVSLGAAADARSSSNASDGWGDFFCLKIVKGQPIWVPCK